MDAGLGSVRVRTSSGTDSFVGRLTGETTTPAAEACDPGPHLAVFGGSLRSPGSGSTLRLVTDARAPVLAVSSTRVFATREQAGAYFAREAKLERIGCRRAPGIRPSVFGRVPLGKVGRSAIELRLAIRSADGIAYFDSIAILGERSVTLVTLRSLGARALPTFERTVAKKIAARAMRG